MSDYGPPPGPPVQGPPPGQPPYGPPGGGYGQPQGSQGPTASKPPMDRSAMLGYAAAGLGLLSFVWGFLDWLTLGNQGESGYATLGAAVVGLSLAAGLVAGGAVLEKKPAGTVAAALAVAAALVALGQLVSHSNPDAGIGLILAFITALVQAGVCVYAYLEASGGSGLSLGGGRSQSGSSSTGSSGGYGAPSFSGGPGGSAGPGGFGGAPSQAPAGGGYDQQPGYGQPGGYEQQSGYGQPGGYEQQGGYGQLGGPSFEPSAQPHPGPGAHAAPQRPAESGGGGNETTVIPRFPTPPSEAENPSTQQFPAQGGGERSNETQHIPHFDPPPNPYAQPPGEQR